MPTTRSLLSTMYQLEQEQGEDKFLTICSGDKEFTFSYSEFMRRSRSLAFQLKKTFEEDTGVIFIVLKHQDLIYEIYMACMLAGYIPSYLPFPTPKQDPDLYFSSHKELVYRTRPLGLVTYADLVEPLERTLGEHGGKIVDIQSFSAQSDHTGTFNVGDLDTTALLQHSSGTTGLKKGVTLTYRQLALQTASYAGEIGLGPSSVVVSWLPLYHDMGLFTSFLIPAAAGARIVALDAFEWVANPVLLFRKIEKFGGTHVWLPNFAFGHLARAVNAEEHYDLRSMQVFVSCSEAVKHRTIETFLERFGRFGIGRENVQACYAMAEASFAISQTRCRQPVKFSRFNGREMRPGCIVSEKVAETEVTISLASNGACIPDIEITVLSCDGKKVAVKTEGLVGEIVIRGPFVSRGYYKNDHATASSFLEGWYRTGDVGFILRDEVYICGRNKELAIVHGRNIYYHDVEEIVCEVPLVVPGRAVAIGVDDDVTGSEELLILVEILAIPHGIDMEARIAELKRSIKQSVQARLEVMPYRVELLPRGWLVKTTSGKLSRVENLRRFRRMHEGAIIKERR